jgi:carbamoyltransferase
VNVLGLHFGHDAGVAVVRDGRVLVHLLRERLTRVKHAFSLDLAHIDLALAEAGIGPGDIDYCAVTSTQNYELVADDTSALALLPQPHPDDRGYSSLQELFEARGVDVRSRLVGEALERIYDPLQPSEIHRELYPEYRRRSKDASRVSGYLLDYVHASLWDGEPTLEEIGARNYAELKDNDYTRFGLHYPVTLVLRGRRIPGCMVQHHAAHAASGYYTSGLRHASIFTHDGAVFRCGPNNGMFYYGEEHKLLPLTPHHLVAGALYTRVGNAIGFALRGAAGKLMGLAPYGEPRFFDAKFVGNAFDLERRGVVEPFADWWQHCLAQARRLGYDMEALADTTRMTAPVNADIAASTQLLFEETLLAAVAQLRRIGADIGLANRNLCCSGGTALNCPTNSRLFRESAYTEVRVEACCNDSGLAIGGALFAYHNVLEQPLPQASAQARGPLPYVGRNYGPAQLDAALDEYAGRVRATAPESWEQAAAADLAANRVIGWFEGRSEVGPRALGHRSILADARHGANWERVNRIKGRELWRPFAPAVLEEEAPHWFSGCPLPSPHMLFTASVERPDMPAITHVDGSARVQTVGPGDGAFRRLLEAFHRLTGAPVLLNTSFNGPGEPIIETPQEALAFLVSCDLDVLYLAGRRVERLAAGADAAAGGGAQIGLRR